MQMEDSEEDKMAQNEEEDEKEKEERSEDIEEEEVRKDEKKEVNMYCGGHRGAGDCSVKMSDKMPQKREEEVENYETEERSDDLKAIAEENYTEEDKDETDKEEEEVRKVDKLVAKLHCGGHRGAGDCSVKIQDQMSRQKEEEDKKDKPEERSEDQEAISEENDTQEGKEDTGIEEEEVEKDETKEVKLYCGGHRGAGDCSVKMEDKMFQQKKTEDKRDTEERSKDQETKEEKEDIGIEEEKKVEEEREDDKEEEGEDGRRLIILLGETELSSFTSCSVASSGTLITVSAQPDDGGENGGDIFGSKDEVEEGEVVQPNERHTQQLLAGVKNGFWPIEQYCPQTSTSCEQYSECIIFKCGLCS